MALNRRQLLASIGAAPVATRAGCRNNSQPDATKPTPSPQRTLLRDSSGNVDWNAVRNLFPLSHEWTHLAGFLIASTPKPVAETIAGFREKIDAEPGWIEDAAFLPSEGQPFQTVKKAIAYYIGDSPQNVCLTPNTTTAL